MPRAPYSASESALIYFAHGEEALHLRSADSDMDTLICEIDMVHIDTDGDGFRHEQL